MNIKTHMISVIKGGEDQIVGQLIGFMNYESRNLRHSCIVGGSRQMQQGEFRLGVNHHVSVTWWMKRVSHYPDNIMWLGRRWTDVDAKFRRPNVRATLGQHSAYVAATLGQRLGDVGPTFFANNMPTSWSTFCQLSATFLPSFGCWYSHIMYIRSTT